MALVTVYSAKRGIVSVMHLNTLHSFDDIALIATVETTPMQLARALPLELGVKSYIFDGDRSPRCVIGYRRDGISYHEPYRGSRGSAATYWLVHPHKDTLILVQHLHAGARTSTHWHSAESELFYPLLGTSTVHIGSLVDRQPGKARRERCDRLALSDTPHIGIRVDPPSVHSLEAADRAPALNLIVIHPTPARTLWELNHNHVEWIP